MNKLALFAALCAGFALGMLYENVRLLSLWAISDALKDLRIKLLESSLAFWERGERWQ